MMIRAAYRQGVGEAAFLYSISTRSSWLSVVTMFVFSVVGSTRRDIEKRSGNSVVTGENFKGLFGKEREKVGECEKPGSVTVFH